MAAKKKMEEVLSYRILAFLIDFLLSFLVIGILLSFSPFESFHRDVLEVFPGALSFIVLSYCLTIVMRFYSCLIFATTPGYLFSGLRVYSKGVFASRLRLSVRQLLSPLLFLFFPTDLLSRGHFGWGDLIFDINYKVRKVPRFLSVALIIGLGGLVPGSVAFWDFSIFDKVQVEYKEFEVQKLSNTSQFDLYETIQSNIFHLSTFTSLSDGLFILLPSLKMEKAGKYIRFSPEIDIYNTKKKVFSNFSLFKNDVDFMPLLARAFELDGYLKLRYQSLYQAINDKKMTLNDQQKSEFKDLILNSMGVNIKKIYQDFKSFGPYPYGHFLIRKNLLGVFDLGDNIKFDHVKYGDGDFIRVAKKDELRRVQNSFLLPLESLRVPLFQLSWPMSDDSKDIFESTFFAGARWKFDDKEKIPFPRSIKEMNPLFIVDYFKDKNLTHEQRLHFEDYVYQYYFKHARNSILIGDNSLRDRIYSVLERLKEIVHLQNSENPIFSDKFENRITNLMKALAKEQRNYFNI